MKTAADLITAMAKLMLFQIQNTPIKETRRTVAIAYATYFKFLASPVS